MNLVDDCEVLVTVTGLSDFGRDAGSLWPLFATLHFRLSSSKCSVAKRGHKLPASLPKSDNPVTVTRTSQSSTRFIFCFLDLFFTFAIRRGQFFEKNVCQ